MVFSFGVVLYLVAMCFVVYVLIIMGESGNATTLYNVLIFCNLSEIAIDLRKG